MADEDQSSSRGAGQTDRESSPSQPPQKVARYSKDGPKHRRVSHACDQCRNQKLRCSQNAPGDDKRCQRCQKWDLKCEFTTARVRDKSPSAETVGLETNPKPFVKRGPILSRDARISALEDLVEKLVKQVEPATAAVQQLTEQLSAKDTRPPSSESWQDAYSSIFPAGPGQVQPAPQPQLPVHTQAQQAVEPLQLLLTQKHQQKPPTSAYPSVSQNDTSLTFPFGASTSIGQHQTYPNQPDFPPLSQQLNSNFGFGGTFASPLETGPKTVSTTVSTGPAMTPGELSGRSGHRRDASGSTKSPPMRSRPIPRVAAAYRMATLADPSSHEAPFRPLTYNPDTFRNSEMSRQTSPEPGTQDNGRRTPKSGKNDAIELGIFAEEQARALFAFFVDEVHFFCPILAEPTLFDHIRSRSSFLFAVILAIASRFCVDPGSAEVLSKTPLAPSQQRHGVRLVAEEKWLEIRDLAMSGYFQTLISKVHCLEDVQATLLLCAWGLLNKGASPDPWMLTGTGYRLAKRLGLHLAAGLIKEQSQPSPHLVAMWKTYLCLYAFDRFLTVGFGRPESEGFDANTLDTSQFLLYLNSNGAQTGLGPFCSLETAACIASYVELANIAREHCQFVNHGLKDNPLACRSELDRIGKLLEDFSKKWLWSRSPLALKLGLSGRLMKLLYDHLRVCLHSVPLKAQSHANSSAFLLKVGLGNASCIPFLQTCLKKTQESAISVIQAYTDDLREDNDPVLPYTYDYCCMVLSHSALMLLRLAAMRVSGVGESPSSEASNWANTIGQDWEMDQMTARRYCGQALSALTRSDRSANRFSCDMAEHLGTIAREIGLPASGWMQDKPVVGWTPIPPPQPPDPKLNVPTDGPFSWRDIDVNLFSNFDAVMPPDYFGDSNQGQTNDETWLLQFLANGDQNILNDLY